MIEEIQNQIVDEFSMAMIGWINILIYRNR